MKRFLILIAFCAVVDFLTPNAQSSAQLMIAPAIIAAIIGLVGSVIGGAMGGKPKNEGIELGKGTFGAPGGDMSGAKDFAIGGDRMNGPQELGKIASANPSGNLLQQLQGNQPIKDYMNIPPPQMTNYNEKIAGADAGSNNQFQPITGPPPQRQTGGFDLGLSGGGGGTESGASGFNLGKVDLSGGESATKGSGFDADKTLQYAAMAATIGSLLNSGKPPNAPSLPGGGAFNAQPTSMRFLYGG